MKIQLNPDFQSLAPFVQTIHDRFEAEGTTIYQARNLVKCFEVDGIAVIVKRYRVPHILNRLIYTFFRPTKGARAYRYALRLLNMKVETPTPIAYIYTQRGGLIHYTYFISLKSTYTHVMCEFGKGVVAGREHILRAFATFTAGLHQKGIYHRDYSPGNILVFEEELGEVHFSLIDINRMSFGPVSLKKGCANFARIWGGDSLIALLAKQYASERKADEEVCIRWIRHYRQRFWRRYASKHPMPFKEEG